MKPKDPKTPETASDANLTCGIVMPISALDDCSEQHWLDVLEIHQSAIETAGFRPNLVSNADDVGIIQKRIIQNLYENPIVVCDVSGKNPNVMFELGIRLAFDKPTIIVKDEKTSYSFDTAPIEHLEYPRDLRYASIVAFKDELARKITSTHEKATKDPTYTTFLKNFGTFTVAKLDTKEVDKEEFILDELRALRQLVYSQTGARTVRAPLVSPQKQYNLCLRKTTKEAVDELTTAIMSKLGVSPLRLRPVGPNHFHVDFPQNNFSPGQQQGIVDFAAQKIPTARWLRHGAPPILPQKTDVSE